jgi:hypothetical protein
MGETVAQMFMYLVEEYDGLRVTGETWHVEAPEPLQAAMQAMDRKLVDSGKPGQLKARVTRMGKPEIPEIIYVYDVPQK